MSVFCDYAASILVERIGMEPKAPFKIGRKYASNWVEFGVTDLKFLPYEPPKPAVCDYCGQPENSPRCCHAWE